MLNIPNDVSCIKISVTGKETGHNTNEHKIAITDECPLTTPNYRCIWQNSSMYTSKFSYTENLDVTPGATYYLVIATKKESGWFGLDCGDILVSISKDPSCPTYSDLCAMTEINSLPYSDAGSTCNGKPIMDRFDNTCGNLNMDGMEYVYHYRNDVESTAAQIFLDGNYDNIHLIVMEGCWSDGSTFCKVAQNMVTVPDTEFVPIIFEQGIDYHIYVAHGKLENDNCVNFNLSILPDNNGISWMNCSDAYVIDKAHYLDTSGYEGQILWPEPQGGDPGTSCHIRSDYANYYRIDILEPTCFSAAVKHLLGPSSGIYFQLFDGCPELPDSRCLPLERSDIQYTPEFQGQVSLKAFIADPGTYYLVVGGQYANNRYRMEAFLTPDNERYHTTCNAPGNLSIPHRDTTYFTPCSEGYIPINQLIECGIKNEDLSNGSINRYRFSAPETGCYLFQLKGQNWSKTGMLLSEECPNGNEPCMASALCNLNCDSLSFSVQLEAGQTYQWTIMAAKELIKPGKAEISAELIGDDTCILCEEDICKACANAASETGTITGWEGTYGTFADPRTNSGVVTMGINNRESRHQIVTAGEYDKYALEDIPVNNPFNGRYSIRLGNDDIGAKAETISYTFPVDANSTFFTYYYAVVFEDPNHIPEEQPYFKVTVYGEDQQEIACGTYEVTADNNIPGFKTSPVNSQVVYKPWSSVSIPIDAYVGQNLTVEFITRDCDLGGHFGYAYLDATCDYLGNLTDEILLCEGDSVALMAPPGFASYNWSDGATGQINWVQDTGDYKVDMVTTTGCLHAERVHVYMQRNPLKYLVTDQPCGDDTLSIRLEIPEDLELPESGKLMWKHNDSVFYDTLSWTLSLPYGLHYAYSQYNYPGQGCEFIWEDSLYLYPPLDNHEIEDTAFCANDSVQMGVPYVERMIYGWSNGGTLDSAYYDQPGDQFLIRKLGACRDSLPFSLTPLTFPSVALRTDTTLCWYDSLLIGPLSPNSQYNYFWESGESTNQIYVLPESQPILFAVDKTNGCMNSDTAIINGYTPFSVDITDDTTVCKGVPVTLKSNSMLNHLWDDGSTTQTRSITRAGKYWLDVTDGWCTASDTMRLSTLNRPGFDLPADFNLCAGDDSILTPLNLAPGTYTYMWNTGANSREIAVNSAGTYTLTVHDGQCDSTDWVSVGIDQRPVTDLPPSLVYCNGTPPTLDAGSGPGSYYWNEQPGLRYYTVPQGGQYRSTVVNGVCITLDTTDVIQQFPPSVQLPEDTTLCNGETLDVSPIISGITFPIYVVYTWNHGVKKRDVTMYNPGTYELLVHDSMCEASASFSVDFLPRPAPYFLHDTTFYCTDESVVLDPGYFHGADYQWSTSETSQMIEVDSPGPYSVDVTVSGCLETASTYVKEYVRPLMDLGPDLRFCDYESPEIGTRVKGAGHYYWLDGNKLQYRIPKHSGEYIQFAEAGPCIVSDTIVVTVDPSPDYVLQYPEEGICPNETDSLYLWCQDCFWEPPAPVDETALLIEPDQFYPLVINNILDCPVNDGVYIKLKEGCPDYVYIPNAFSPNDDNINEVFAPVFVDIKPVRLRIFTRWGEEIFTSEGPLFEWDGRHKGKLVEPTVYVWQFYYIDAYGAEQLAEGHVTVLR